MRLPHTDHFQRGSRQLLTQLPVVYEMCRRPGLLRCSRFDAIVFASEDVGWTWTKHASRLGSWCPNGFTRVTPLKKKVLENEIFGLQSTTKERTLADVSLSKLFSSFSKFSEKNSLVRLFIAFICALYKNEHNGGRT